MGLKNRTHLFFDHYISTSVAWYRSFHKDEVLIREHFKYFKAAHFDIGVAGLASHAHAFHYFGSERGVTERTWCTKTVVLAVCLLHDTAETVALNDTLETFTFRGAGHVDVVAFGKNFGNSNDVSKAFRQAHVAELKHFVFGCCTSLFEVAEQRGGSVFHLPFAVSQLQGSIAVGIFYEDLRHHAGASFDDRTSDVFTVLVENAGHPDFFSNQTVHGVVVYVIERLVVVAFSF